MIDTIRNAIKNGTNAKITYVDGNGEITERHIRPELIWTAKNGHVCVRAYCHLRGETRTFRAENILEVGAA